MNRNVGPAPQRTTRTKQTTPYNQSITVGEHVRFLLAVTTKTFPDCPKWPADVFAIAASLLARGGAYASILKTWPPSGAAGLWTAKVKKIAKQWRRAWQKTPTEVVMGWALLKKYAYLPIHQICQDKRLLENLMLLSSVADETCVHAGIPIRWTSSGAQESEFYLKAQRLIRPKARGSTLCERISPTRVRVLPKMHTPQSGMTIRSISLNLALVLNDEIVPKWHFLPQPLEDDTFNVLVLPWPFDIPNGAVHECVSNPHELRNMPPHFGFFTYDPAGGDGPASQLEKLFGTAALRSKRIHAVVLPELAVTPAQFESLSKLTRSRDMHLIAGVCVEGKPGEYSGNEVRFASPSYVTFAQQKHHRWKLSESQIRTYKLLDELSPKREWWEHIDISSREFNFFALGDGLVISALICEDLARPDPVGDLLRAVGPNVVFALLMDGPQINDRWPGRYAASLADDPGSSVLSVTSLGMSLRSKRPKKDRSRVVALWHSPSGESDEIELPKPYSALLLSFEKRKKQEWAADGRDDSEQAAYLHLKSKRRLRLGHQTAGN